MSSATPSHDVQITSGDLAKPDHQRLLRLLFDDLPGVVARDEAAGALDVTRPAQSRRHGEEHPSSLPRRGSVQRGDAA